MFMQIFATLFIGGFVTGAAIGHIALLHALCAPATDDTESTHARLFPGEQRGLSEWVVFLGGRRSLSILDD
jgi:hypothetical protein